MRVVAGDTHEWVGVGCRIMTRITTHHHHYHHNNHIYNLNNTLFFILSHQKVHKSLWLTLNLDNMSPILARESDWGTWPRSVMYDSPSSLTLPLSLTLPVQ